MSLGTLGSTLNDEINRLANGGTYRDSAAMVDEALAAKQWANRENISPYSTDTVGVLNEIAGLGLDKKNWLDFNGVCNYIAGTSGLPAAAALRQIYPTTDLLTGVASYYIDATDASASGQTITNLGAAGSLLPTTVGSSTAADSNDAKFLDHTGTNYVYTTGVANNYLSTPDAAPLDITGDIDLRVQVALDDWTPSASQTLLSKLNTSQFSYQIILNTSGTISFRWSTDGTTLLTSTSSVAPTVADGAVLWVRATMDVDNGASGNTVTFFTSNNGTTWTQLGTTIVTAGVTSIYSGTAVVEIGAHFVGSNTVAGKIYRAQILNGIGGTTVLDVDTSVITSGAATSFTAVTGQTVTINRSTSGRKTVAVTQPTWLFGTDDYMEVNNRYMAHSTAAENYVYLSGATSNYMSIPDNPPLDVTGDLDLRARISLDNWSSGGSQTIVSKRTSIGNQRSYRMVVSGTGGIFLEVSADGTATTVISSTTITSFAAGTTKWIRATFDSDNGAGGNTTKFFTSDDGVTWTQLGADVVNSGVFTIYSGTAAVELGSCNGGLTDRATGKIFRGQIRNGIDGTIVLDADASVITLPSQTTFVDRSSNAYTVTINKSGVGTFVSTGNYLYLPGIASNYASAPDASALDVTGDIDLRCKVALDDWTPSTDNLLIGKWSTSNQSYYLAVGATTGILSLRWTTDGSTANTASSSVAPTVADGATLWVRATLDVDNGASGNTTTFFTSTDGLTWTQLGTTVVTAGVTSIFSGTGVLEIGTRLAGTSLPARGKFFRAQVLNGIGGTVAFDANFESSITSLNQTTFTESSTNGATVTINRSGSTYRSAGVIDAGYLYPGATNTFSNSTTNFLDFTATESFTLFSAVRLFSNAGSGNRVIFGKQTSANSEPGYMFTTNARVTGAFIRDTSSSVSDTSGTTADDGSLISMFAIGNRSTNLLTSYTNTSANAGTSIATVTGSTFNPNRTFMIGRYGDGSYSDMEFVSAAVFRSVLTTAQIRQIVNYFANREVYL